MALFPVPVHADSLEEITESAATAYVHFTKKLDQNRPIIFYSAQDFIAEGDYWKGECERQGDLYDRRADEIVEELDFFKLPMPQRRERTLQFQPVPKDPEMQRHLADMRYSCNEATKNYNQALMLTRPDDFRQQARIQENAAGVYDNAGNKSAAEDARDEAAFARGRQDLKSGSDCLIVTATFGSPMAGEVQLVRNFRDDTMKQNYLGLHYVTALNAVYYSFSPAVARAIDENPSVKPVMRLVLAPLIGIVLLSQGMYSLLGFSPGLATGVFIITGGALVGLVYIMPVMLSALWVAGKKQWQIPALSSLKPLAALWAGLLAALVLSAVLKIDLIAVLSSGLLFVCTVFLLAGAVALSISGYLGITPAVRNE